MKGLAINSIVKKVTESEVCRFCEPLTGELFMSTKEDIEKAVKKVNVELNREDVCSFNYFLKLIGLRPRKWGYSRAWSTIGMPANGFELSVRYVWNTAYACYDIYYKWLPEFML